MEQVSVLVPSSSANVGPGFDIWCLGLAGPQLRVTGSSIAFGVELGDVDSPSRPPAGRRLGHAGLAAAERFLKDRGLANGVRLSFQDDGYPVGGLGRSGAEAVGAVLATASLRGVELSRDDVVLAAAKGEPGGHLDNAAGSTNGRFNIVALSPDTGRPVVRTFDPPADLGVAIGYSSHGKTAGTEGMREVLRAPVPPEDFAAQCGLVSAATAALLTGDTDGFLELAWGDRYHEPRRADIGGFGPFTAAELASLKRLMFREFGVALNVSGAGPNFQLLYSLKGHHDGLEGPANAVSSWCAERGLRMRVETSRIAADGAYDRMRASG